MKLFDKEYIKKETRALWKENFHDSDDFLDLYFEEKYTDETNLTVRVDGRVGAAVQVFPYRMTFAEAVCHAGYLSGLTTAAPFRNKGMASGLIRDAHRRLYKKGALFSFLIPGDEALRHFYEKPEHGAYWTASFRAAHRWESAQPVDDTITVTQPDEWGSDLFVFYHKNTENQPYRLHPTRRDFYAALADCDLYGGRVLVARRKSQIVGLCLATQNEGDTCHVRSWLVSDEKAKNSFAHYLHEKCAVGQLLVQEPCPSTAEGSEPYAMARVINVEAFLKKVLSLYPTLEMHIGVDHDWDIPENNGYYLLANGKVTVTEEVPADIFTPGGLAALFLSSQTMVLEMMLDE